jgi:hypothetical protein
MYEIDVEACFRYIKTKAPELGKAEGELIRLEAKVKAVKAALMEASDASSAVMKESDSLRDPKYMDAVKELANMTAIKVELGIMVKAAFQKIETDRSQAYLARAELRNIQ